MERRTEAIMSNNDPVTEDTLKGFLEAFNRHDVEAIMAYFAEECVVNMPRGAGCALRGGYALGVWRFRRVQMAADRNDPGR